MSEPADPLAHRTIPLYQTQGQLYENKTSLVSVQPLSSLPEETRALFKPASPASQGKDGEAGQEAQNAPEPHVLTVSETIFHAQGGGQPSDTGTMTTATTPPESGDKAKETTFTVSQVRSLPTGAILHMGFFPSSSPFTPPTHLRQAINIPLRTLHSRLHTAGHVIGLAVNTLIQRGDLPNTIADSKASHYPNAAYVTFTGSIPSTLAPTIQSTVDEMVAQDLPVSIFFWDEDRARRECYGVGDGAELKGDEMGVRVVEMGGKGSYPCGGTHVERLGELARVVVKGVKRSKGVSRISYDVADV
ncbi:metal-dependent hydrolase related to alanyl-tRNA synthetase HxxxH domain [Pyrenophora tritici-repentis]|nr:metal-dependent hydrolase related to alanyl-tRNA synthetase HxxxH domain protein [Pyrenophora tritici-repentis]KAI1556776.1 metal-dependent hydrolase related to alanyl-tRNA synthetase HxxxH domain [Pyrenophora tritici-repentis]KAI1600159.1 metal-dependent hydrolase related to alanyl-tRNA synthetase HxxxH domain [Pyrenophora tritici-repentis]PZD34436.1 metal-dependent hydrolases alanyl-tRNA synthetase HxxxH domain protein [Pyrenophora tritici-repentis]